MNFGIFESDNSAVRTGRRQSTWFSGSSLLMEDHKLSRLYLRNYFAIGMKCRALRMGQDTRNHQSSVYILPLNHFRRTIHDAAVDRQSLYSWDLNKFLHVMLNNNHIENTIWIQRNQGCFQTCIVLPSSLQIADVATYRTCDWMRLHLISWFLGHASKEQNWVLIRRRYSIQHEHFLVTDEIYLALQWSRRKRWTNLRTKIFARAVV